MRPMTERLADAQQSGVYQLSRDPDFVERASRQAGLSLFRIDIAGVHDKKDFLDRVAKALSFPEWFGHNWDALNDCLTDLEWLPAKGGYILLLENTEQFGASRKQDFHRATEVFRSASEFWKAQGRPFWTFVISSSAWDSSLPRWP